jgi:beta-ureidopropionase / N-carbamoyl-L-amino-acid hydrolase
MMHSQHPDQLPRLQAFNTAAPSQALQMLDGLYEHSPWVVEAVLPLRPFLSLAHLKHALCQIVTNATEAAQRTLLCAHPELAGKAMQTQSLTAESSHEQQRAGLTQCTPEELSRIAELNAAYRERFGFPFILAVRGPRGLGLTKQDILATFERRLLHLPAFELQECLRNVHRIAEIRLNDKLGYCPTLGEQLWDWQENLAQYSEPGYVEHGQLTVTYLTGAHQKCAQLLVADMLRCGCDEAFLDAVGNVVGRFWGHDRELPMLLTGSHYDTVRNAGKYDGRLGIYVPLACIQTLAQAQQRLPFGIEVIAFAEEEGQRYKATFLASSAITGHFDAAWLAQTDAEGIAMRTAMQQAGLQPDHIPSLQRNAANYLGFIEVHIEQGPVLNELNLPLGIVTSINASARYALDITGMASHAGTTPMNRRRDAAAAAAEIITFVEQRASADADSVGTVGMLQVPSGSINVVPGKCHLSLDLRAPSDAQRDGLVADVLQAVTRICQRRGVQYALTPIMQISAAPSAPEWQQRWEQAVAALGLPIHRLPSGAGHDAMQMHHLLPQAMLFVRGQNSGISHNPLESTTSDDMQLAAEAFALLLQQLSLAIP